MYECGSAFICIAILGEILLEGLLDWSVGGIIQKKLADSRFGLKPRWFILEEIVTMFAFSRYAYPGTAAGIYDLRRLQPDKAAPGSG